MKGKRTGRQAEEGSYWFGFWCGMRGKETEWQAEEGMVLPLGDVIRKERFCCYKMR